MPKVTLSEIEVNKLARAEFDVQRWQARQEALQAQHALVQVELATAKERHARAISELSERYGRLVSCNLETGEAEVEATEANAEALVAKLAKKK